MPLVTRPYRGGVESHRLLLVPTGQPQLVADEFLACLGLRPHECALRFVCVKICYVNVWVLVAELGDAGPVVFRGDQGVGDFLRRKHFFGISLFGCHRRGSGGLA